VPTHRHADDFSFEWFEHGRKILSGGGKYAYTRVEWQSYFKSTRAHNTIEVDGLDFSTRQKDAYGDAVTVAEQTSEGITVIMQVYHDQPDLQVGHRREIYYRPGEELRIKDTVGSSRPRVYVQWHHFARADELSGADGRFQLDDGGMRVALETSTERHMRWVLGVECRARHATFETDEFSASGPQRSTATRRRATMACSL
jgi:Heparinase II/III-like protein